MPWFDGWLSCAVGRAVKAEKASPDILEMTDERGIIKDEFSREVITDLTTPWQTVLQNHARLGSGRKSKAVRSAGCARGSAGDRNVECSAFPGVYRPIVSHSRNANRTKAAKKQTANRPEDRRS